MEPSPTPESTIRPSSTVQSIDAIRDSMSVGNIAFNKPKVMTLDESSEIQLVLSPTVAPDELKSMVTSEGEVQTKEISVSDYMEATLSGENFKIVNPTQRKLVSNKGVTEWRWDVTPIKSGPQRLHLTLNAIVNYKDGEKPLELRSFHEMIEVNVTFSQRFFLVAAGLGTHLQWLVPSLLIPISLWGWNRWKKRKKAVAEAELEDTAEPDAAVEPSKTKRTTNAKKKK